jgi:hypothetical protein
LETYYLLQQLRVLPEKKTNEQIVKEMKELLKRLTEENNKIALYATSGEGSPEFWNPLKEEIMNAISHGMKFFHCLGPVICTDNEGKHASIEVYKEYPKSVELWLSRTRNIYHLKIFTPIKVGENSFYAYGECHHKPLAKGREIYSVSLEDSNDPFYVSKMMYLVEKLDGFETLKIVRDKIKDLEAIPTAPVNQLKMAYNRARKTGKEIGTLTSEEILNILYSKPL